MGIGRKTWVPISFFLLSLFLAYSPFWVPYYVNLFQSEKISILGKLSKYEVPCSARPVGDVYCSNQYAIPKSILREGAEDYALGLGQILVYTKIGCFENGQFIPLNRSNEERSVNQNYQTLHSYFVVSLAAFRECASTLAVQAWAARHDIRHGYYGGLITSGSVLSVERIKKLIEFILVAIPQNLAMVGLAFFLLINQYFGVIGINAKNKTFYDLIPFWFLTFLFTSGLMLTFIPLDHNSRIFARIGAYFSMTSHLLLCVYSFKRIAPESSLIKPLDRLTRGVFSLKKSALIDYLFSPLSLVFIIFVSLPAYSPFFAWTSLAIAVGFFFLSFGELSFLLFTICYILGVIKIFNVEDAPMSNLTFYYAAFLFSYETYNLVINELNDSLYSLIRKSTDDENLAAQIVHDIRSPMQVLRLLLSQITWKDDKQEMKEVVLNSLEQISAISKTALLKHRKYIGDSVDLANIVLLKHAISSCKALHTEVIWAVDIPDILDKMPLSISPTSFSRVLQNLLNNATEATGVKRVNVVASSIEKYGKIFVSIENDGRLIPSDVLQAVLQGGGTYQKEDGTGLGVRYCKNEIELNGGTFNLTSISGWTKVEIILPVKSH